MLKSQRVAVAASGALLAPLLLLTGCATVSTPRFTPVEPAHAAVEPPLPPGKVLRRKLAIARFSNETRYACPGPGWPG